MDCHERCSWLYEVIWVNMLMNHSRFFGRVGTALRPERRAAEALARPDFLMTCIYFKMYKRIPVPCINKYKTTKHEMMRLHEMWLIVTKLKTQCKTEIVWVEDGR